MSRIIVKNLPKKVEESTLRELFSQKGNVTDVQLKYTKDGKFRQFAFVGFESPEASAQAIQFFDKTFIKTSKISVEPCNDLTSKAPSAPSVEKVDNKVKDTIHAKDKIKELLTKYKDDPKFQEFIDAHARNKELWRDGVSIGDELEQKYKEMVVAAEKKKKKSDDSQPEASQKKSIEKKDSAKKPMVQMYTVKLKNLPKNTKRQDVIKFFKPLKPSSVRIPGLKLRFAYAGFKTKQDLNKALLKHKSFFNGKQVEIIEFTQKNEETKEAKANAGTGDRATNKWNKQTQGLEGEEDICESGKLFFRNLAYSVNEGMLQELFEKYGPVAEVNAPLDSTTRRIKGFGTVTFLMPEHAVRAYNELNGTQFHGRMFHLIPGKANDKSSEIDESDPNYKKVKMQKLKKTAGSSHNWNTLFLGANAIAEVMAKNFNKTKAEILDVEDGSGSSAAVRLALGETQIVMEMKKFLEDNGVSLKAFDDQPLKRSKNVLMAKNLPAGTSTDEIVKMFAKFGVLGRVLLPPSGVTCIIEFVEPSEARKAFKGLAYKMHKGQPLYLEWAPEETFSSAAKTAEKQEVQETREKEVDKTNNQTTPTQIPAQAAEIDDTPPEPNTTLFIKNLNFATREPAVRKHFEKIGPIHTVQVAMRKDPNNPTARITLGYGFIQFKTQKSLESALKNLQLSTIEGNTIELKRSDRTLSTEVMTTRKKQNESTQTGTKILVRNIPFQAKEDELRDLFKVFGEIRALRLPQKLNSLTHRGYGFVDFFIKEDARQAYESFRGSVHLYGRRLVLEWAIDAGVDEIRKRTAEQFSTSNNNAKRSKAVFAVDDAVANDDDD